MKIFLSVGHSVLKNGNITSANGVVNEYKYNKEMGAILADYLRKEGHTVDFIVCPERQFTSSKQEKTYKLGIENKGNYDLTVELHLNASVNKSAGGCECYYYSTNAKGKAYADRVCKRLGTVFKNRGSKPYNSLYMVNGTKSTCCYVEAFFCSNADDCNKGADKKKVARLIAEGICDKNITDAPQQTAKPAQTAPTGSYYRVQVGAFTNKANAEKLAQELKNKGYDTIIK